MSVPIPISIPTGALVGSAIRQCHTQWDIDNAESRHLDNISRMLDDMIDDANKENERLDKILSNLRRETDNMRVNPYTDNESNLTPIGKVSDVILRVIIALILIGIMVFLICYS